MGIVSNLLHNTQYIHMFVGMSRDLCCCAWVCERHIVAINHSSFPLCEGVWVGLRSVFSDIVPCSVWIKKNKVSLENLGSMLRFWKCFRRKLENKFGDFISKHCYLKPTCGYLSAEIWRKIAENRNHNIGPLFHLEDLFSLDRFRRTFRMYRRKASPAKRTGKCSHSFPESRTAASRLSTSPWGKYFIFYLMFFFRGGNISFFLKYTQ
jgi:hypothetical protein